MMKEILAPAGDKESFFTAINFGADAVYLGINDFSARKSAENFSLDNLKFYIDYAHLFSVKVYVALNTLIKDNEMEAFLKALIRVHNCGADAIIMQDFFLAKKIKSVYPDVVLHLSTQGGCCNEYVAKLAQEVGFSRVILSRETKLEDIKKIAKILPVEAFVQGALCTCFSGQCYLSSFIGKNSGNRGHCKQPCRKKYKINRNGYENLSYKISLADLCVENKIFDLIEVGVCSFKIEGRMRRKEYVATAITYYRALLDGKSESEISKALSDLKRTYNRGNYTKGLAFGQDKSLVYPHIQGHIGEKIGTLTFVAGKPYCKTKTGAVEGDAFKIIRNNLEVGSATTSVASKDGFFLLVSGDLKEGDNIHITTDKRISDKVALKKREVEIQLSIDLSYDQKAKITVEGMNQTFAFEGEDIIPKARTRSLTREEVKACFNKVNQMPFAITYKSLRVNEAFITKAQLNEYRRIVYTMVFEKLSYKKVNYLDESKISELIIQNDAESEYAQDSISVIFDDVNLLAELNESIENLIYKPKDFYDNTQIKNDVNISKKYCNKLYLYTPCYASGDDLEQYKKILVDFDGIYSDSIYALEISKQTDKPLFVGTGFNIFNSIAMRGIQEYSPKEITISKELTNAQISKIIKNTNCKNLYRLSFGNIKLMDLIYCPFSKNCATCDKKDLYYLTDENERKFVLRRYQSNSCRFELYNCVDYISDNLFTNTLFDLSATEKAKSAYIFNNYKNGKLLREKIVDFTYGYSKNEIY